MGVHTLGHEHVVPFEENVARFEARGVEVHAADEAAGVDPFEDSQLNEALLRHCASPRTHFGDSPVQG